MFKGKKFKLYKREKVNLFLKNPLNDNKKYSKYFVDKKKNKMDFAVPTHYYNQLKEKRKLKIIYGISEKKYNYYYNNSRSLKGNLLNNLLSILEFRLDNIVYRSGFSTTRNQSKQLINHNFIKVNNNLVNSPSKILNIGDIVSLNLNKNFTFFDYFNNYFENKYFPDWIFIKKNFFCSYLKRSPSLNEISNYIDFNSYILGACI